MPEGVQHVRTWALVALTLHQTGNWLIRTDCCSEDIAVNKTASVVEVATCARVLTPVMAKCCAERAADASFGRARGGNRTIACSRGVQVKEPLWNRWCSAQRRARGLKRLCAEFDRKQNEAFNYNEWRAVALLYAPPHTRLLSSTGGAATCLAAEQLVMFVGQHTDH